MTDTVPLISSILEKKGFKLGPQIGAGAFSKVFVIKNSNDIELVCKVIDVKAGLQESGYLSTYHAEINILTQILHPNVIKIYNHFVEEQFLFMILEMCKGGSLQDRIKSQGKLAGTKLLKTTHEIVAGLEALHERKIAHHDIKPANILFDSADRAKLADFGFAAVETGDKINRYAGSVYYMAPEVLKKVSYDPFEADIWALGVSIYQMATGQLPYKGNSIVELTSEIALGYSKEELQYVPSVINKVIRGCLHLNPEQRITTKQIMMLLDSAFSYSSLLATTNQHLASFGRVSSCAQNLSLRPGNLRFSQGHFQLSDLSTKPKIIHPSTKPKQCNPLMPPIKSHTTYQLTK